MRIGRACFCFATPATTRIFSPTRLSYLLEPARAERRPSRPRARRRLSPSTWPVKACSPASATWLWPAASASNCRTAAAIAIRKARSSRPMATAGRSTTSQGDVCSAAAPASSSYVGSRTRSTSGDTIHAVIRGSAVNNDGARKAGYLAPSVDGQAERRPRRWRSRMSTRPAWPTSRRMAPARPSAIRSSLPRSPKRTAIAAVAVRAASVRSRRTSDISIPRPAWRR